MRVLLTGANGFLGSAIRATPQNDCTILTLGKHSDSMIVCDLRSQIPVIPAVDTVIHAAGKAHVTATDIKTKNDFFKVNVQGTQHLLTALEQQPSLTKFIFISSVAVYGLEHGVNVAEGTPLLAVDAYGRSKIAAEKLVADWCTAKKIDCYILRLPLLAGKYAPGNLGTMVKAIQQGRYVSIANGEAKKSMVLACDLGAFILSLRGTPGTYHLTDGHHPSFRELENKIALFYGKKKVPRLPLLAARMAALAGDIVGAKAPVNSKKLKKITSTLTFTDASARQHLHWLPRDVLTSWQIE